MMPRPEVPPPGNRPVRQHVLVLFLDGEADDESVLPDGTRQ